MHWGCDASRWAIALEQLQPAIAEMLQFASPDATGGGSNNWAIGAALGANGRSILMGDPHRDLEVLSMYTQAHLKSPSLDLVGLTVPGVPGFPHVGHNEHVAWCVTVAFVDLHDLYIEQFSDNGNRYRTSTGWEDAVWRIESISVRGSGTVDIEMCETKHGPVIVGDPRSGNALTLKSVQFTEPDTSFDCLVRMMRAATVEELYEGTRGWGLIDHNLVAADTLGSIGNRVRAKVPDRPRANGWLPVPGWLEWHEWKGMIPFEAMPACIDPPGHRIVTANNRVTADAEWPYLSTDCIPPHRARRIQARLDQLDTFSVESMKPIFGDFVSIPAELFKERLGELELPEGDARRLRDRIASWNCQMDPGSEVAASYSRMRLEVTQLVAELCRLAVPADNTPWDQVLSGSAVISHLWWIVPALLRESDTSLLGGKDWAYVLAESLERAAAALPSSVPWADLHTPTLVHPLSSVFPESADELNLACVRVGGDGDTVMATAFNAGEGLRAAYSSLARYTFDVGAWSNCEWIVFQGASGHPGHPNRNDQNQAWGTLTMVPMLYDWNVIRACGTHYRLKPGQS